MGPDGTPNGYLSEQAGTYVRSFLDNEKLFPVETAKANMAKIQEQLLAEGYTMYLDGYSTYFFNDNFYKAAQQMDQAGDMHFVLGTAYEMDSWMDVDAALAKADDAKKYTSKHIKPNWIKLFMDGTVESGTGFVEPLYPDGHQGIPNWTEEEMTNITRRANERGLTMHVHVMGNKGVERMVNAFIKGGKDEMRNTLVHVYGVNPPDYKRMADHNIYVTEGMLWHQATDELQEELVTREQALQALTINVAKQMFLEHERGSIKQGKYADFLLVDKDVLTCPVTDIHQAKPTATYFEGKKVFGVAVSPGGSPDYVTLDNLEMKNDYTFYYRNLKDNTWQSASRHIRRI